MSIRLTILGKSPSWQDRDGACSGYEVEVDGGRRLLIDCGNGVFGKLRRYGEYERIDAVLISHLHADHLLDLVPFAYALTYGPKLRSQRPALHAPPGARAALRRLCGAWGSETLIENAFELTEYDPAAELELEGLRANFRLVPHYVPSYAVSLDGGGGRLVFSADCGPNEALVELARDAELLLIEATLAQPDLEDRAHLTAAEAGEIGRRAGVKRLVLTHFSDVLDPAVVRAAGERAFSNPVALAVEGESHEI
ncbi:MAG TPA: MBL fold metallo-hydrolase [Solirubrobacteraceae bacterium]|nr:MBL fold metallo-hydrolase [Solirubrobacteraceae bacterium]